MRWSLILGFLAIVISGCSSSSSNTQSTAPTSSEPQKPANLTEQQQAPTAGESGLGLTTQELQDRFSSSLRSHQNNSEDMMLGNYQEEAINGKYVFSIQNGYMGVGGVAQNPSRKISKILASTNPQSVDAAAQSIICFATLIDSINPGISQDDRNDILKGVGLWGEGADAEHLHGNYVTLGKRYKTSNSSDAVKLEITDAGWTEVSQSIEPSQSPSSVAPVAPVASVASEAPGSKDTNKIGKVVRITSIWGDGKAGPTMAADSTQSFLDVSVASFAAKDSRAGDLMVEQGKIVMLAPQTVGQVTEYNPSGFLCKVHLQSGEHIGQDWWVMADCCEEFR